MRSAKGVGRVIGLMFAAQILLAPVVYVRLIRPGTGPGFLESAAGSALQVRVALLLSFVLGALTLAIAIAATPVFRRSSERMTLAYLALSVVGLSTLALESLAVRNMLALSQVAATGAANESLRTLAELARSAWVSAHFTTLTVAHATGFVLYAILYRSALVPRALAGFGMAAALLSTTAVAMPLLGYRFRFLTLIPVALSQLTLVTLLILRGFAEPRHRLPRDAERLELARS